MWHSRRRCGSRRQSATPWRCCRCGSGPRSDGAARLMLFRQRRIRRGDVCLGQEVSADRTAPQSNHRNFAPRSTASLAHRPRRAERALRSPTTSTCHPQSSITISSRPITSLHVSSKTTAPQRLPPSQSSFQPIQKSARHTGTKVQYFLVGCASSCGRDRRCGWR
jgi:hypothetical protein